MISEKMSGDKNSENGPIHFPVESRQKFVRNSETLNVLPT